MKSKGFFGILKWTLRESLGMIIVSIFSSLAVSAFIINKAAKASDLIYTLPDIKKNQTNMLVEHLPILMAVCMILCLIQTLLSFSFLYSKRKIDFFNSSPVKREMLFAAKGTAIAVNAGVMLVVAFLSLLISSSFLPFYFDLDVIGVIFLLYFVSLVFAIAIIMLFAVLEGTIVNTIFSSLTALLLVPFSCAYFFSYAAYIARTVCLPMEKIAVLFPISVVFSSNEKGMGFFAFFILARIVLSAAVFALGIYFFKKRRSEKATNMKPSLVTSVMFLTASILILFFFTYLSMIFKALPTGAAYTVAYIAVSILFLACVFIFIRPKEKKKILTALGALGCFIIVSLAGTLIYQSTAHKIILAVPDESEIESVNINNFTAGRKEPEEVIINMFLSFENLKDTQAELIDAYSIKAVTAFDRESAQYVAQNTDVGIPYTVTYKMKNGRKITRVVFSSKSDDSFSVDNRTESYYNFINTPEYAMKTDTLYKTAMEEEGIVSYFSTAMRYETRGIILSKEQTEAFFEAYRKDVEEKYRKGETEFSKETSQPFAITVLYKNDRTPEDFDASQIAKQDMDTLIRNTFGETSLFTYRTFFIENDCLNCLTYLSENVYKGEDSIDITQNLGDLYLNYLTISFDNNGNSVFRQDAITKNLMEEISQLSLPADKYFSSVNHLFSNDEKNTAKLEKLRQFALKQTAQEKAEIIRNNDSVTIFYFTENDTDRKSQNTFYVMPAEEFEKL